MIVRNKYSGEFLVLPSDAYEVENAFIVPLQCLYKKDYEKVEFPGGVKEEKEKVE